MYDITSQFGRKHKEIYHFKTLDLKNIFLSKFDNSIEFATVTLRHRLETMPGLSSYKLVLAGLLGNKQQHFAA